ncbi:MAG: hypothetical protein ACOX1X_00905 [Dethiobacteria bacterium]|jgi:putative DNA methylase
MQCESNLLGIVDEFKGTQVGSGGWRNIIEKYVKAKQFCQLPFEIQYHNGRKKQIPIKGEWIGNERTFKEVTRQRIVDLRCSSSTALTLEKETLDAVLTDPPYYANVQYAELMDFCLRMAAKTCFQRPFLSTCFYKKRK